MKRTRIIVLTILIYSIGMIGMFIGVQRYIKEKDSRLRLDIHSRIEDIFEKKRYIDIAYSGYKVGYERIQIPEKPSPSDPSALFKDEESQKRNKDRDKKNQEEWDEKYGNLFRLNRIKFKRSDRAGLYDYEDGWNLITINYGYDCVYQTLIFPYAVGYIKQDYSWGYDYLPSVKSAVENALEFYTTNDKSYFIDEFEKGNYNRIWSKIYKCKNEYYFIGEDSIPRFSQPGTPLFASHSQSKDLYNKASYQAGYMHNNFYKVFIAETQPTTWSIKKYSSDPDKLDMKRLWRNWTIGLTSLLMLIVIPLWVIERKRQKIKNETLYDKLKRLCHPSNFFESYNKEKVEIANTIYQRLMDISSTDEEIIDEIQKIAVSQLGVVLIDQEKLDDLKEKINPKNYMNPYNAEKVTLANDLYSRSVKSDLTYGEFTEIEKQSKKL